MNILLTNDDGVYAIGLLELQSALAGEHDIYIIAPDTEMSACSNAITTRSKLKIREIRDKVYSVSGFPADCVNIGINGGIIPDIDIVLSGINHGPNVGNDVIFSGTVAGARTAYVFGKSGIAVSLDSYHKPSIFYKDTSQFIKQFIQVNKKDLLAKRVLLNINYPDVSKKEIKGVVYTHLGNRIYRDQYHKEIISDTEIAMKLDGSFEYIHDDGSDVTVIKDGYISITPLSVDCTDITYLQDIRSGTKNVIN